jgi:hypothetical protein
MSDTSGPGLSVSARMRLARLAQTAALGVPGVIDTDRGGRGVFASSGGGEEVPGVTCTAAAGGGYDVGLRLRCQMVPLLPLADAVRMTVQRAARGAQIAVADVSIEIVEIEPRAT